LLDSRLNNCVSNGQLIVTKSDSDNAYHVSLPSNVIDEAPFEFINNVFIARVGIEPGSVSILVYPKLIWTLMFIALFGLIVNDIISDRHRFAKGFLLISVVYSFVIAWIFFLRIRRQILNK
jgi:hypothetical protein